MSTGADCQITERTPGAWFYKLQRYPYGDTDEYDTFGPFPTYRNAREHLSSHHANPGGYSVSRLPGCPHDLRREAEFKIPGQPPAYCDRCGAGLDG